MDTEFRALAEPRRREILRLVWDEELPAARIAAQFPEVTRPAVSQHLSVLRQADLVVERREGTRRFYRSNHPVLDNVRQFLDGYWSGSLDRLQHLAESDQRKTKGRKETTMAEVMREVVVDAGPATIFPFLTDPELHLKWLGTEAELDPRPGGLYRVNVQGIHPSVGEFVEVVPNERVVFTFGWDEPDHPIPAGSTQVEITLTPDGDKTRVRLVHRGLPADAVGDHGNGWQHYLDRLAVATTGGDAGPDTPSS